MANFLKNLTTALFDQVGLGESSNHVLSDIRMGDFSSLGKFANKIDRSAHREYLEDGIVRNIRPRNSEILMQQPDIAVVVKKRAFSSLSNNFKPELMDDDEKLFLKATKKLFENKCRAIAAYERLSKFEKIAQTNGVISDYALPLMFNVIDTIDALPLTSKPFSDKTRQALEAIRQVKAFSDPSLFTTWISDKSLPYSSDVGEGTGTFELTLVSSFNSNTSVETGRGNASITVEDPYKLMFITNDDIEQAIGDVTNSFSQNNFFKIGEVQLEKAVSDLKQRLNAIRFKRGATSIIFKLTEEDVLFKKVRALIDEEGREIIFNFDAGILGSNLFSINNSSITIDPSASEGPNGLKDEGGELNLFKQIIKNIYILVGQKNVMQGHPIQYNILTDSLRRKMRLHYANKSIIQPMDVVSIFVSTKASTDSKTSQGMDLNFTGSVFNDVIGNIENSLDSIKASFGGGSSEGTSTYAETEKNVIAGPEFPMWLWNMMKNDFTRQAAGTCVFNGIVTNANRSWSGGKYILDVKIEDNIGYFKKSQININPAMDVYNGPLYDPLTPFKTEFDEITGTQKGEFPPLLDGNVDILNSQCVNAKNGRWKGENVDINKYINSNEKEPVLSVSKPLQDSLKIEYRNVLYDPDGFVYKWKEGIGSLTMAGNSENISLGSFRSQSSSNITTNPLAGQDVINVLSLLITGEPYNFNNFVKSATDTAKLWKDDINNQNTSVSYFRSLLRDIKQKNSIWGNFIPFKKMIINESGMEFLLRGELEITNKNAKLTSKLRERAEAFDALTNIVPNWADQPSSFYKTGSDGKIQPSITTAVTSTNAAIEVIRDLDDEIKILTDDFNKDPDINLNSTADGKLEIFGNDISFDSSIDDSSSKTNSQQRHARTELRRKLNSLLQRRLWRVKGNSDINYFIIDDAYDKNYDIRAFEKSFARPLEQFKSVYSSIYDQLNVIPKLLGLELFADTQGHVQARPPQYNRMPSSVFARMLQNKISKGIRVFPKYLERLFYTNVKGFSDQLEIIEDEIRLRSAVLGRITDGQIEKDFGIKLITSGNDGKLGVGQDIRVLFLQDAPDLVEQNASGPLKALSKEINSALNAKVIFSIAKRVGVVTSDNTASLVKGAVGQGRYTEIASRLKSRTNENIPGFINDIIKPSDKGGRSELEILRVTDEIAQFVAERQRIVKLMANSLKNLTDGLSLEKNQSGTARELLYPNLRSKDSVPQIMEHMIEDENIDDLGPGSGKRYVIREDQIININIGENQPEYNMVEVDGRVDEGMVNSGGFDLGNGANSVTTAFAVDYDLWQMYGLQSANPINLPFFSDAVSQCAPYAVFLLNLARKNIIKGSVSIAGNEYIQPGEVYYIEDYDLLFYSQDVSHSYTYGGSYTTNITLVYGHNPGEYIPTHLDIIGKAIYTNRHLIQDRRHSRHDRADNSQHIATIIRDTSLSVSGSNAVERLIDGKFGEHNKGALSNILLMLNGFLTPGNDKKMNIELRIYNNSKINLPESSVLMTIAQSIRDWISNPTSLSLDKVAVPQNTNTLIDKSKIKFKSIDLAPGIGEESPSQEAWSLVRNIVGSSINLNNDVNTGEQLSTAAANNAIQLSQVGEEQNGSGKVASLGPKIAKALVNTVIDIWVTFVDEPKIVAQSGQNDNSQAGQQNKEKLNKNKPS